MATSGALEIQQHTIVDVDRDAMGGIQSPLNYSLLTNKKLKMVKKSGEITDMSFIMQPINDTLWCITHDDVINIYNKDCDLQNTICHQELQGSDAVTQVHTGDVIVACSYNKRLHQLSPSGSYLGHIAAGSYSGVAAYHNKVYALEWKQCKVVIFEQDEGKWCSKAEIQPTYSKGVNADRVSVSSAGVFVSSCDNDYCIYHFSLQGILLQQTGKKGSGAAGEFDYPLLCGADDLGNLLVADVDNHRLQLYNQDEAVWSVIQVQGELNFPQSAVLDPQGNYIWILTTYNDSSSVHKYSVHDKYYFKDISIQLHP